MALLSTAIVSLDGSAGNAHVASPVGGHGARPATIGYDGQAVAQRAEFGGQCLGGVEELADVLDANHAGTAHGGIENGVGNCGHARMGGGSSRARFVATGLEQDNRLDAGRGTQGAHETPGVADAFDIHQDVMRAAVIDQIIEDFTEIDVGGHAKGDD
jgi:hypothetical protein